VTKDLRHFLKALEEQQPDSLLRVPKEVSPRWELSAVQKRLQADGRLPVLFFERIQGHALRLVTNLFASKRLLAFAMGTTPELVGMRFAKAQQEGIKPRLMSTGPVKEVILTGDDADLRTLPIVTHCEKDAGPYITAGVTIVRDPATGSLNAGIYRSQVLSPKKMTLSLVQFGNAAEVARQAEARGENVEAAIVLGHHPAMGMASQQRDEIGTFELETMGALLGEAVDVVRCETVDVLVPADAEIVIEGRIVTSAWEQDGPFGEYMLYYGAAKKARVFEVTAITRRRDAIFHDIFNVGPEHPLLFALGMEGLVLRHVRRLIPQITAVNVPTSGTGNLIYVQVKKVIEGLGVNAALAVLGAYRFKCAIVVDEDVDIFDDSKVLWAVMTRAQADRSFFTVPGSYVSRGDPSAYAPWHSSQKGGGERTLSTRLGIDATKPLDPSFPEVAEPPHEMWTKLDLSKYLA
jgi:2,5-furandicarboxylate decarboxylase 1